MRKKIQNSIVLGGLLVAGLYSQTASSQGSCYTSQGCSNYANFGYSSTGAATLEYDNYVSAWHSTVVRDIDGTLKIWGELTKADGVGSWLVPTPINVGNYPGLTGKPLKVAMASSSQDAVQFVLLTDDSKLWVWGYENWVVDGSLTGSTAFQQLSVGLPSGVSASQVKMMTAFHGGLVITSCAGNVYVLAKSDHAEMRGNGTVNSTTGAGSSTWYQVEKATGGALTGIVATRTSEKAVFALDNAGNLWTWGLVTWLGAGGTSTANSIYSTPYSAKNKATQMTLPGGSGSIKMIGVSSAYPEKNSTYYVLYENGGLYSMGHNWVNQLGDWTTVDDRNSWVQPRYNSASGPVMNDIKWISTQENDDVTAFINVINNGKFLYNWGEESGNDLGRGAAPGQNDFASVNPGMPSNFESPYTNSGIIAVESGGHTTMILKECVNNFGYVGHRIHGSMGDNTTTANTDGVFHFKTAAVQVCGAVTTDVTVNPATVGPYCRSNGTVRMIGSPAGGTFAIDAATPGIATINSSTGVLTFTGTGTLRVNYTVAGGTCGTTTVSTVLIVTDCNSATVTIPGKIWSDTDRDAVIDATETGISNGLWANLVGPGGTVIASVKVNSDGTYTFVVGKTDVSVAGSYSVILTNYGRNAGDALSAPGNVPLNGYVYTGTNRGTVGTVCTTASCEQGYLNLGDISASAAGSTLAAANFGIGKEVLVAIDDINQTPKGVPVNGNVLTNDEGPGTLTVSGAQAYTSTGSLVTLPLGTATAIYTPTGTAAGTITLNPDGSYSFVPAPGFTGDVPVNYTATNGTSNDTAILEIKVLPATTAGNEPPVAQNDNVVAEAGTPVTSSVLTNDSDPDGDALTVTGATINSSPLTLGGAPVTVPGTDLTGNPVANAGTLVLNTNGTYTYTPSAGFSGTVTPVTYTISDGHGGTDTAVLSITVFPNTGNMTIANDDANTGVKGQTLTGDVKTNDTDPEGNATTVTAAVSGGTTLTIGTATTLPGQGVLTLNANGTYTFVPDPAFVGTVVVKYTACDNGTPQACDEATLYLTLLDAQVPDLTPFITVSPNDMVGTTAFTSRIRILNLANAGAATTGAVITVRILKSSLWSFTWDGTAASNPLGALNNSIWTYSGSGIFHTWTTNTVIPVGSSRYIGFSGTFIPGATTGNLSMTVQIAYPSGGERNDTNNTDVEKITYTGQ